MKTLKACVAAAAMGALSGTAQAALVGLGDGTVKDTNSNLIWLQNWNVNGQADWGTQKNWADNLDFAGSSDWTLPTWIEYSALFDAYRNLGQVPEFTNVQFAAGYWSATEIFPGGSAFAFGPTDGGRVSSDKDNKFYAVAVRPGDATTPVPEPQTLALLALGATMVVRRRRPA